MNIYGTCFDGGRTNLRSVKMDRYEVGILPNGRYQVRGISSKCSSEIYRFVSEKDAKKIAKGKTIKTWSITPARLKELAEKKRKRKERKERKKQKEKEKKLKEKEKAKKLKEKAKANAKKLKEKAKAKKLKAKAKK